MQGPEHSANPSLVKQEIGSTRFSTIELPFIIYEAWHSQDHHVGVSVVDVPISIMWRDKDCGLYQ